MKTWKTPWQTPWSMTSLSLCVFLLKMASTSWTTWPTSGWRACTGLWPTARCFTTCCSANSWSGKDMQLLLPPCRVSRPSPPSWTRWSAGQGWTSAFLRFFFIAFFSPCSFYCHFISNSISHLTCHFVSGVRSPGAVDGWRLPAVLLQCFGFRTDHIQEEGTQGTLNLWIHRHALSGHFNSISNNPVQQLSHKTNFDAIRVFISIFFSKIRFYC